MCSLRALRTLCETIFYFFEPAELKFGVPRADRKKRIVGA